MKTPKPPDTHVERSYRSRMVLAGYVFAFVSGWAALVYEVLWVRRFVSLFGATAPAASATLSAMFVGLAAGSLLVGRRSARWRRPLCAYGILEVCIALPALTVIPALGLYERVYPAIYNGSFNHPLVFVAVKTALATAALFAPAFLTGGTLPLLAHAFVSSSEEFGKTGSVIYAANTFGAVLGALAVPFLLLPTLGAEQSYLAAAASNLCVGALAILLDRSYGISREPPGDETRRAPTDGGAVQNHRRDLHGRVPARDPLARRLLP